MKREMTLQKLQDWHFTLVEEFFHLWVSEKESQIFLSKLSQTDDQVSKVIFKLLQKDRNPLIENGSIIIDKNARWSKADILIKSWKNEYQFDVHQFIINYEQSQGKIAFHQLNDPVLTLNTYASIIAAYIVTDYLKKSANPI